MKATLNSIIQRASVYPVLAGLITTTSLVLVLVSTIPKLERAYDRAGIAPSYPVKVLIRASHLLDR